MTRKLTAEQVDTLRDLEADGHILREGTPVSDEPPVIHLSHEVLRTSTLCGVEFAPGVMRTLDESMVTCESCLSVNESSRKASKLWQSN